MTGLILSTIAAIIITINSLYGNIKIKNKIIKETYNNIQESNNSGNKDTINTSL